MEKTLLHNYFKVNLKDKNVLRCGIENVLQK
jgi:hypothetical protein